MRFVKVCLFLVISVILSNLLLGYNAGAEEGRWDGAYNVESRRKLSQGRYNMPCESTIERVYLGTGEVVMACVFGETNTYRVARLIYQGSISYAVSGPYESSFRLTAVCKGVGGCVYSYTYDALIEPSRYGISVYSQFSKNPNSKDGATLVFRSSGVSELPSVTVSRNGRWVGMFMPKEGYAVMDLSSRKVKQVLYTPTFLSGKYLLAVTGDGHSLVVIEGGRVFMIEIYGCGVYLDSDNLGGFHSSSGMCIKSYTIDYIFSHQRSSISHVLFSEDDVRLVFEARYNPDQHTEVIVFKSGEDAKGDKESKYLALGDSFTSGEGETDRDRYIKGTDTEYDKCHVSNRSYPHLLLGRWGIGGGNVSCSGAVMSDLFGFGDYMGQNDRLGSGGYGYGRALMSRVKSEALDEFKPGYVRQLDFISKHQPTIVSVSIGGNDAGLMSKLSACLAPSTCDWASEEGRSKTAKELQRIYRSYTNLFHKILETHPGVMVFAVGYPMPIRHDGSCSMSVSLLLNKKERSYIGSTISYLNDIMEAAAKKFNIPFIDIERAYDGYRICEDASHPAMNFIRFGSDIAPFLGVKVIGAESFHPKPFGHQLAFNEIIAKLPDPYVEMSDCVYCDQLPDYIPSPPEGLGAVRDDTPITVYRGDISKDGAVQGSPLTIGVPSGVFLQGSTVDIVMKSNPKVLASNVIEGTEVEVVVPSYEEGAHTIFIRGTTDSGESLEVYKSIYITPRQESMAVDSSGVNAIPLTTMSHSSTTAPHDSISLAQDGGETGVLGHSTDAVDVMGRGSDLNLWAPVVLLVTVVGCLVYRYLRR